MKRLRRRSGYTLIEVMTAAVVIGAGVTAAVSMSSTLMMQEDIAWRGTVAVNYQENCCRLWQLGLSPAETTAVMPSTAGNPLLNEILYTSDNTDPLVPMSNLGFANQSGMGVMQGLSTSMQTQQIAADAGSNNTINVYRPTTTGTSYEP
jgi:prepilin-type N-terminal cleavage/methylation domain-containing protein